MFETASSTSHLINRLSSGFPIVVGYIVQYTPHPGPGMGNFYLDKIDTGGDVFVRQLVRRDRGDVDNTQ